MVFTLAALPLAMAAALTPPSSASGGAPSSVAQSSVAQSSVAQSSSVLGPITAEVERVVDGDTVRVKAHIWIDQSVSVSVRLAGIDAPELYRPKCAAEKAKARAAKKFAANFVQRGQVRLYDVARDKYAGRVVARIENAQGEDLAAALEHAGLAQRRQRGQWCT